MNFQVHRVPHNAFVKMARQAMRYALLSSPFTVNRMGLKSLERRIENILKGKLAEFMMEDFCKCQHIDADFKSCSTPFYQIDNRDFLLNGYEWDIKNNYLSLDKNDFNGIEQLPALVPDRFKGDQWSKREKPEHNSKGVRFLFSFMIKETGKGRSREHMMKVRLSKTHSDFLMRLLSKHKGLPCKVAPFKEDWFWEEWKELSEPDHKPLLSVNFDSPLLIAGWAGNEHWNKFRKTKPASFANGIMRTRIDNQVLESDMLSSFPAS